VQRIETAVGDAFDPNTMEAMTTTPCPGGDAKPGSIANIWQVRCTELVVCVSAAGNQAGRSLCLVENAAASCFLCTC
jgi:hypothetical protein